ncbi:hypothetical protein BGX20_011301 [Mortierella sp. AD010]|nr:hypothetical protein BGX20_011301 [Mortierella sp. AD010]
MANEQSELMKQAQALMKQKDDIEAEIRKAEDELHSQKVGMTEKLVDSNGFPRSDIDLVVVTTARSNITRLKNDHKAIMLKIEESLHAVHAEAIAEKQKREAERKLQEEASGTSSSSSSSQPTSSATQLRSSEIEEEKTLEPFARINSVAPNSPSEEAKPIVVKILRGESTELHSFVVVPRKGWGGLGTLGCYIVPA